MKLWGTIILTSLLSFLPPISLYAIDGENSSIKLLRDANTLADQCLSLAEEMHEIAINADIARERRKSLVLWALKFIFSISQTDLCVKESSYLHLEKTDTLPSCLGH